jgi:putative salt-induced outer membrane protein
MKVIVGVFLIFFISTVFADQITMKDGDRLTGEIVKKDSDSITVKSKNFGTVTLKWADIATVKSDQPLNVTLAGGKTVKANIETQGDRIQVAVPGAPQTVDPKDVVTLRDDAEEKTYQRYLHPRLLDLWTITGGLNLAGTKGNAQTSTLTTPVNFLRASNTTRTTAYFNSISSSAKINGVDSSTAKAVRGGWAQDRNLGKKIFANVFNDYEYDKFQSLDLRVVIGGGVGYHVWSHDASHLSVVGGIDWNRASFGALGTSPAFTRNSAEAFWGDDFNYKISARTSSVQTFRMFDNLSDTGEYRMNADAGATTQLTKWLNWSISLSDRYLSNPAPASRRMTSCIALGWALAGRARTRQFREDSGGGFLAAFAYFADGTHATRAAGFARASS